MANEKLFMYSGSVSFPHGAPTIMDIAIGLMREGRYCGAGMRFWPVGLHTMVVCDLVLPEYKLDAWLHDSTECITGDIPKPTKIRLPEVERMEEELLHQIYEALKIPFPNNRTRAIVKQADKRALHGEVYTVGTQALQNEYPRCPEAEELVLRYSHMYDYNDMLDASGRAAIDLMAKFREYKDLRGL